MASWKAIQSLLIFFGPLLIPRALAYYRSLRSRPQSQIRELPEKTSYALAVLFASAVVAFVSTFPFFSPTNIFTQTQSRLTTPGGVLLSRLSALRSVTPADEKLRKILDDGGLDAHLIYARFGPDVLTNCPLANPGGIGALRTYLFYALPKILAPHLLHLFVLGVATSGMLSGKEGSRWRLMATIAGMVLGLAEFWFIANYDDRYNARSTRLSEVDFVYWKMQVWRGLAIATMDGVLGWVMWLQATGRAFLTPTPVSERLSDHAKVLEGVLGKARGLSIIRNGTARDANLQRQVESYWVKEGEVMKDVFEEPEVLEAQRNALRRLDVAKVGRDADSWLDGIFGGVQVMSNGALRQT